MKHRDVEMIGWMRGCSKRIVGQACARLACAVGILVLLGGCQELVHMGQLSDRQAAHSIRGAKIEQQQPDRSWELLGETDGNGRWWIMKKEVLSGSMVRITKRGYHPLTMSEGKFLQEYNLLMIPTGE